jgi:hypothetical protein
MSTFITFTKSETPLPSFPIGTKMKCLQTIDFADGTQHLEGEIYIVESETKSYYACCYKNYEVVN